jgi:hypothetical protein
VASIKIRGGRRVLIFASDKERADGNNVFVMMKMKNVVEKNFILTYAVKHPSWQGMDGIKWTRKV